MEVVEELNVLAVHISKFCLPHVLISLVLIIYDYYHYYYISQVEPTETVPLVINRGFGRRLNGVARDVQRRSNTPRNINLFLHGPSTPVYTRRNCGT
jgi:hypothetical protein